MACTSEKSASLVPVLFALASRMTAARYCSSWKSFLLPTAALSKTRVLLCSSSHQRQVLLLLVPPLLRLPPVPTTYQYYRDFDDCHSYSHSHYPHAATPTPTATPTTTSSTATIPVHMPTPNYTTPVATATSAALQLLPVVLQVFASGLLRMAGVLE